MDNQNIKIPQSVLKENEKKHACKSTKKERRKKVMKFADEAEKAWGKPSIIVAICLKNCLNRDKKCDGCYKFSMLKRKI
jgi:hypothetical protein